MCVCVCVYVCVCDITVDWVVVETLCLKQGRQGGRTRYILKESLKYFPLYGWILGEVSNVHLHVHVPVPVLALVC